MKYLELESRSNLRVPEIGIFDRHEEARHLFKFMKAANSQETLWSRSIAFPKGQFEDYRLIPISQANLDDQASILHLMNWRNENFSLFSPQRLSTIESTTTWLNSLLTENPNRVLFLLSTNLERR
jgi:hypothetical protein